jgi:hypothetical protein
MSSTSGLSPEDYIEIQNLYAYYNLCSDAGDAEGYASCFAKDGVLRIDSIGLRHQGRDMLRAFKKSDAARRGTRYRRHWNGSLHLRREADGSVTGRCYLHGYNGEPGRPPELADVGSYVDRIVKEDGAWCFAERLIAMDASSFRAPQ